MDLSRNIRRYPLYELFEKSFEDVYIDIVVGQRQIGKTTFIKNFLENKKIPTEKIFYLNLDQLDHREEIIQHGLLSLIESYFTKKIKEFDDLKIIFIDEVQKLPSIFEEIKIIFDEFKYEKKIKFVLSGSSALNLYNKSAESLAGRVHFIRAHSFSLIESKEIMGLSYVKAPFWKIFDPEIKFEEIILFKDKYLCPIPDKDIKELISYNLVSGTIPDVVKYFQSYESSYEKIVRYLKDYKNTYIEKDIRTLERVGEISSFSKFFDVICTQATNLLVKANISRDLGISHETIMNYLSVLENTFIIDIVRPYLPSSKKRIIKTPKVFIFDNGLISLAHGFPSLEQLDKTGLIGSYFENLVLIEIKKHLINRFPYLDIYFYRTQSDAEIDFILDYKKKVIPVEVKWQDDPKKIHTATLKTFIKEEENCEYGIVIYNGEFEIDKKNKIIFFPFEYFAAEF